MFNEIKIKCFLSLAETLNFTNTAKALFISQQAVSKHISRLEQDLGFRLFIRTHRSVILTPEGEQCYQLFSKIYKTLNSSLAEIRYQYLQRTRSIRIGYQNFLDFGSVPNKAFKALQKEAPDLQLDGARYPPQMLIERLLSRQFNIILINGCFAPVIDGLKSKELTKIPKVLMIAADHPMATENATYRTFMNEPFIIDAHENESQYDYEKRVQHEISILGFTPPKVIWVPDRDSAYTYAEMGHGFVLGQTISRMARDRNLKCYPTGKMETLLAIWHEDEENGFVEKYVNYLYKEYKNRNVEGDSRVPKG